MSHEVWSQLITTIVMMPFAYLVTNAFIWVLEKNGNLEEWWRGFAWGLFFWASVGDNIWKLIVLLRGLA